MEMSADPAFREAWIPARPRREFVMGLSSLVMVVLMVGWGVLGTSAFQHVVGWLAVIFFGSGSILFLSAALMPGRRGLQLDSGGFKIVKRRISYRVARSDIAEFRGVQNPYRTPFVG